MPEEEENPSERKADKSDEEDFYLTEEGYKVFTEKFHLRRGYCCQNGCRHCPYGFNDKEKKKKRWLGF